MPPATKIALLHKLIETVQNADFHHEDEIVTKIRSQIRAIFGAESPQYKQLDGYEPIVWANTSNAELYQQWGATKQQYIHAFHGFMDELEIETTLAGENKVTNGLLQQLEESIIAAVYDYVLKTPSTFDQHSRSITQPRRKAVKARDNNTCQLCQKRFPEAELEIDHIYPHSLGGSNDEHNLMSLCRDCNLDKGKRLDYYRSEEGRLKVEDNIRQIVRALPMIADFGAWLHTINQPTHQTRTKKSGKK